MDDIIKGIQVMLIFLGFSMPILIVFVYAYFVKRLEHKQTLAAIEKGIAPADIKLPKQKMPAGQYWEKNLTAGIALLIIAAGLLCFDFFHTQQIHHNGLDGHFIIPLILFALGIARVIRGLIQKKSQPPQNQNQTNTEMSPPQQNI